MFSLSGLLEELRNHERAQGNPCPERRHNGRVVLRVTNQWARQRSKYRPHTGTAQLARQLKEEAKCTTVS